MAVSLKHSFQSAKADGLDTSLVRPSDWNAEHTLSLATSRLLGRTTAGTGAAEEISVGAGLTLSSGSLAANTAQVDIFTSSGTYTKPSWATTVEVICIGGGGGGSSGRKGAAGTTRTGGSGGGGAGVSQVVFKASDITSTVSVTVGAGGTGGAAQTANSTNGNDGSAGGSSSFGTYVYASGGGGAIGGAATQQAAGTSGRGTNGGGTGGASSTSAGSAPSLVGNAMPYYGAGYGGGGGGPVTSANVAVNGGQGVNTTSGTAPPWKTGVIPAPANSVVTGAGNSGTDLTTATWLGGESGDGGAASTTGNAFAGGNGGKWGGGGGGGGAAVDSVGNSGAGGNGGAGICVVISRA